MITCKPPPLVAIALADSCDCMQPITVILSKNRLVRISLRPWPECDRVKPDDLDLCFSSRERIL